MPLNIIRGGGAAIFRHLQSHIARVPITVSHSRNIYLAANSRFANPVTKNNYAQGILFGKSTRCFATEGGGPKSNTGKAKPARKTTARKRKGTKRKSTTKKRSTPAKSSERKKQLTPEKEEKRSQRVLKLQIRQLKKDSLRIPKMRPTSPYTLAFQDKYRGVRSTHPQSKDAFLATSIEAKSLSSSEKQKYVDLAEKNAAANVAEYKDWCRSYTPLQIKEANMARRKLAKLRNDKRVALIRDDRLVKQPRNAFLLFATENLRTGDSIMACAEKWKALSEAEKEKYVQLQVEDSKRYRREYEEAYGEKTPRKTSAQQATA